MKDLETKIPGMLADLKKNLEADEVKKRMNRDLKESVKRNKSLTDTKKQVEEQLKAKEEKYQSLLANLAELHQQRLRRPPLLHKWFLEWLLL